jgi:hypothetical protein
MTSRLIPAIAASLLMAFTALVGMSGTVLAQTAAGQAPATQVPTAQPPASAPQGAQPPTVMPPGGRPIDPPQTTPVLATDTDHGTALMLLDRISKVLDDAVNRKASKSDIVGTSGSNDGPLKVVIDRAALDEIRAEITQIRLLLQSEPRSSVALRPREKNEAAR